MFVFLVSCREASPANDSLSLMEASKQELVTALDERDQLLSLVKEMTLEMKEIRKLEDITSVAVSQSDVKSTRRTTILSDIKAVKETLMRRRNQLEVLEHQFKESGLYNEELIETIGALRGHIDYQTGEIDRLRAQLMAAAERIEQLADKVDSLNVAVTEVESERDSARMESLLFENELNTCYYVAAGKSQLRTHNIIESGFLRRTKLMNGDFDQDFFAERDKRNFEVLAVGSKKARVLTNHPEGSFRLRDDSSGVYLEIIDKDRFWSLTNYLVVQTD
ncbi:MAG: hypothetical protein K2L92_07075 [Muribaculaceae bacterium]|nr:hypothetical protein [Muribaculaceae bacterium]